MNGKFNKNKKVEKFTSMLGLAVRLIVIDPLYWLPMETIEFFRSAYVLSAIFQSDKAIIELSMVKIQMISAELITFTLSIDVKTRNR